MKFDGLAEYMENMSEAVILAEDYYQTECYDQSADALQEFVENCHASLVLAKKLLARVRRKEEEI